MPAHMQHPFPHTGQAHMGPPQTQHQHQHQHQSQPTQGTQMNPQVNTNHPAPSPVQQQQQGPTGQGQGHPPSSGTPQPQHPPYQQQQQQPVLQQHPPLQPSPHHPTSPQNMNMNPAQYFHQAHPSQLQGNQAFHANMPPVSMGMTGHSMQAAGQGPPMNHQIVVMPPQNHNQVPQNSQQAQFQQVPTGMPPMGKAYTGEHTTFYISLLTSHG